MKVSEWFSGNFISQQILTWEVSLILQMKGRIIFWLTDEVSFEIWFRKFGKEFGLKIKFNFHWLGIKSVNSKCVVILLVNMQWVFLVHKTNLILDRNEKPWSLFCLHLQDKWLWHREDLQNQAIYFNIDHLNGGIQYKR